MPSLTPTRRTLANAIRFLAADAVQQANSGHPGAPMGMADIAQVLWRDHLKHSPNNPKWPNRDRFVLSNGHGSMLLYALLNLTGYPLSIDEIKRFRQFGSHTAGHPEHDLHLGIETTTGPLGQGITNAVGFPLAEKLLASEFNRGTFNIVDHHTYVFLGDGCLMEGISHEVCSLAGTLKLDKLVAFYDDNGISIDGEVHGWFTDDTPKRFAAYGWHVVPNVDGHDPEAIEAAIQQAKTAGKPTLICCKTVIGFGAPNKQGTEATHGAALGADEVAATRKHLEWPYAAFEIPAEIRAGWDCRENGAKLEKSWDELFAGYAKQFPELASEFKRRVAGELPGNFQSVLDGYVAKTVEAAATLATRQASQATLNGIGPSIPELLGGSADLTGSNNTNRKDSKSITGIDASGNYLHYGVREFGMAAIMNGLALHGGFIPYGGTFLVFSDYARNGVRMSALMKQRVIYVFTHDSIGLGEDGPTHQPVEHAASLRLIPNMQLWRPCDTVETAVAWGEAIKHDTGPSVLVLTRQALAFQTRTAQQVSDIKRGGYVLVDCAGTPELILIGTGSELALAVDAAKQLTAAGKRVRVVSIPNVNTFEAQDAAYREQVLPVAVQARVIIEAGVTDAWYRYAGLKGEVIGMHTFGASAPAKDLFKHFGFTVENVVQVAQRVLAA
jgi:transketolase